MQNSKRPGMTHASSTNNDVPKNTTLIQIQPNSLQHQKLIPINSMQKNLTSKLYAIQRTSGPTHFLPVQCNNGQFLRLQNPSGQLKQNIIQLPATPVSSLNTSNATLISLQPQSVNTQNVNFRTVTPSLNNSQFILSNNKLLFKSPTPTVNQQQGKTNFIKINPAPQSLVGSVSNGQSTPLIRIDNSGASSNFTQSQQKIFILNSSPMKVDQYIPEKVFIQDNNAANLPMQVDSETCQSNAVNQTMFQQTNQQHVEISTKPKLQDVSFQDQLNNTIPQNFLLANMSPQKADASIEKQKTVPGTLLLLNNFQKQQVLIPKASQSNQVFVPITLAGNLSLINSQTDVSKHTAQQRFIPLQYDQSSKTLTQVNNQPQQQSSIFISGQGVQQEAGGAGSSFIFQPISNTKSNSHSAKSSERKSHKSSTSSKNSIKPKETSSSSAISKSEKKPCNCTKSQCLKLYCECFANGEFCSNCNCRTCRNNIEYEAERSRAIKVCLERNPYAFHPKIGKGKIKGDTERRHTKGCNCKRSGCLKNYCECFEAKILCSSLCRCSGCKNFLESADQKTLMHLADAAEERVLQQNAARSKLATEMTILESKPMLEPKERLPSAFITHDVTKATCETLLARVQEAETAELSVAESERIIFEEFSRCLNQIIDKSKQQKQVRAKR